MPDFYRNRQRNGLRSLFILFFPLLFVTLIAAGCSDRVLPPGGGDDTAKDYRIVYNRATGKQTGPIAVIGDNGKDGRELPGIHPLNAPPGLNYTVIVIPGTKDLGIVDLESGETVRTIPRRYGTRINYFSTAISPDAAKIAYSIEYDDHQSEEGVTRRVVVVNADGSNPVMLSAGAAPESYVRFSPDGNYVAFFDATTERNGWLYVARTDGTDVRRIADVGQVAHDGAMIFNWSPDGKKIAYTDFEDGGLRIAFTDGSGVTMPTYGGHANWSPDGKKIVFLSGELESLAIMNDDGSGEPESLGILALLPQWSPDGKKILYFAMVRELDPDLQTPVMSVLNMQTKQTTVLGDGYPGYWLE